MSDAIMPVSDNDAAAAAATANQTTKITGDPTTQAASVQSNATPAQQGGGGASGNFSNMAELKRKQPEFYRLMMESIGMKICNEMRDHQAQLKKMMREAQT